MTTDAERITRLETSYEHLATKQDLADLKTGMVDRMAQIQTRMVQMETRLVRWTAGGMFAVLGALAVILRFLG